MSTLPFNSCNWVAGVRIYDGIPQNDLQNRNLYFSSAAWVLFETEARISVVTVACYPAHAPLTSSGLDRRMGDRRHDRLACGDRECMSKQDNRLPQGRAAGRGKERGTDCRIGSTGSGL